MVEYVTVRAGKMAEDLVPGRSFPHPGITLDRRALRLAEVTGNSHEIYRDENYANLFGHKRSGLLPPFAVIYIGFCQGVEDLSLNSDAFRGMYNVSVGSDVYNGDSIMPTTVVYGRKPKESGNNRESIVGFRSTLDIENDIGVPGTPIARWYRVNNVNNGIEEVVPYQEGVDLDPEKPPSDMKPLPYIGTRFLRDVKPEDLKLL